MGNYVNIMAKVSPATAARMDAAVDKLGLRSKYEFMQLAVKLVLMYVDPSVEPATPELQEHASKLRSLWGDLSHLRFDLATVKPNSGRHVEPSEIITFYGRECLMLRVIDSSGNLSTSSNVRDIAETVLYKTLPADSMILLRAYKRAGKHPSLLIALVDLLNRTKSDGQIEGEIQKMFDTAADADPRALRFGRENKPARAKNKKKEL